MKSVLTNVKGFNPSRDVEVGRRHVASNAASPCLHLWRALAAQAVVRGLGELQSSLESSITQASDMISFLLCCLAPELAFTHVLHDRLASASH